MASNQNSKISLLLIIILGTALFSWTPWQAENISLKHFQDDELAYKYCPVFVQAESIKPDINHIYYRMAEDDKRIFLACHPVWPYEKDESKKGLQAIFNKLFYTGGLKLQRKIFGPEDIEAIEIVIDKESKKILRLRYESASHIKKEISEEKALEIEKPVLEVITWNHMFELITLEQAQGKRFFDLRPEYFTEELWNYYQMTKKQNNILSQDRAHFEWEHD